jgi:hypothetical protein
VQFAILKEPTAETASERVARPLPIAAPAEELPELTASTAQLEIVKEFTEEMQLSPVRGAQAEPLPIAEESDEVCALTVEFEIIKERTRETERSRPAEPLPIAEPDELCAFTVQFAIVKERTSETAS